MVELTIGVYNTDFELIGVIDEIENLQITNNLTASSTFSLNVVLTPELAQILKVDNYIILNRENEYKANVFIIEYQNINLSSDGTYSLQIQGRNLVSLLARRVVTKLYNVTNINAETIIKALIFNELINTIEARKINNLNYIDNTLINTLVTYSNSQLYSNLLDEVTSILTVAELGISVTLNLNTREFNIELYLGQDKTLNADYPIIFSTELNNIMSEEFTHSTKDYVNVAYVYGEVGTSDTQELVIVDPNNATGINRYEQSLSADLQGVTSEYQADLQGITTTDYKTVFQNSGEIYIKNKDLYKCFSANLNIDSEIQFRTDFNLGDTITCISNEWGINEDLQITQAVETWSNKGYSVSFQLGKSLPTIVQKLNRIK